jgi:hypothetical protein
MELDESFEDVGDAARSGDAGPAHPFYGQLHQLLDGWKFDQLVEALCGRFYQAEPSGTAVIGASTYFRMLIVGLFEGLASAREIAWRVSDSLSLRRFVGFDTGERVPDHAAMVRTRRLIDPKMHEEVLRWVISVTTERGLGRAGVVGMQPADSQRVVPSLGVGIDHVTFLRSLHS